MRTIKLDSELSQALETIFTFIEGQDSELEPSCTTSFMTELIELQTNSAKVARILENYYILPDSCRYGFYYDTILDILNEQCPDLNEINENVYY